MADPISWLVLEPGHKTLTTDGEELGTVKEVLGDAVADIFDGLLVTTGALGIDEKYVPAELVDTIDSEAVHLTISAAESDRLGELTPPGDDT